MWEPASSEHLKEHRPERPDVAPFVQRLPARLLGGHVGGGAHDHAHLGGRRRECRGLIGLTHRRVQCLGQPEVQHLHGAVLPHLDVRGLQVPVDHPGFVRGLQRLRDLFRNRQRLIQRDRAFGDPVGEGWPFDQFQDERLRVLALLDAVDSREPRMVQAGQHLRFPLKPSEPIRVRGEGVGEDLQRDVVAELRVGGAIDLAHAAFADESGDVVMCEPGADF